jgi:hypothetical protein
LTLKGGLQKRINQKEDFRPMFSRLKNFIAGESKAAPVAHYGYRRALYEAELGAPDRCFADTEPGGIEILAFSRDFSSTGHSRRF